MQTGKIIILLLVFISFTFNSYAVSTQDGDFEHISIPDIFIPFETGDKPEYIFVVEKESQLLFVYEFNGTPKKIFETSCSTGKSIGDKNLEGDAKTPEGIYFFIKEIDDAQLAPIYGIGAFPTDYPNLMDRIKGKTGSAIWLHGTNKELKPRDSNGCVALDNSDFNKVSKYITLNRTPIIIVDKLNNEPFEPKEETKQALLEFVSRWETALEKGTYHEYLSYYDSEYVPDISWWANWNKTRKKLRTSEKSLVIEYSKTAFFKHKQVYVVLFDLYIRYGENLAMAGTKKIFLNRTQDQFNIIGENYQVIPDFDGDKKLNPVILASRKVDIPAPVPAPLKPADTVAQEIVYADAADIESLIDNWLSAWSSKDIEAYGSFYADSFRAQGMNKKSWVRYKDRLNKKYKYIRVSKKDLKITNHKGKIKVSFVQNYESNAFKASGLKNVVLKLERGQWKIYREKWKKI